MKKLLSLVPLILIICFITSCEKEVSPSKVDKNGLTKEITDLVPQYILDRMKGFGMPINGGGNPPIIEGTYYVSPVILLKSSVPDDVPLGTEFSDVWLTLLSQNNNDLTVMVNIEESGTVASGLGSFIVGDGNKFSVFVELNINYSGQGRGAKTVKIYSGELINNEIANLYFSVYLIDNYGNPEGLYIGNGEGRLFYDQDGISEKY